jgi:ubiquitin-like 1-activating enzyme E1 B
MVEIPLKPKQPVQPPTDDAQKPEQPAHPSTDDATVTGKRKREGSNDEVEPSSHDAKRLASASIPDSNGIEAIVLDDDEEGAIMIDD